METIDAEVICQYLDNAVLHAQATNDWAEGYWIGRAIEHATQNAVGYEWLVSEMQERGLDTAVVAVPKTGDPENPSLN